MIASGRVVRAVPMWETRVLVGSFHGIETVLVFVSLFGGFTYGA